ncbi:MAG: exodeoxyribonuclease VII large subunit [Acidimicrobiales bacterium]|nr:exodeoxyribonuclease VII large subunit [Acidimicrobiales bacterium]MCB9392671.1 exodeoxyribonuclease VII large subunit [Acidimicrobiaceae bacterium]
MSQPSFDFGDDLDVDDEGSPTYTVGELADAINGNLRRRFGDGVWVRGEIQGWNERGPHAYFRLVEDGEQGRAVLNVQFFAPSRMRLRPILAKHRLRLADGLKVRIFGHLDFFAGSGSLGLKMSGIDPRFTLGDLAMQREQVLRRLVASGMYDANRRRPLAAAPLRIGVITSVDSAAWADFSHEIERSGLGFQLRVCDVRVQGEWAVGMVSTALQALGRHDDLDALVLIRGGGARSELATFDAEEIAVAIATSPLPVLTGLGHEIDRSVADEVAHTALKTPTACAAALVERVHDFCARSEQAWAAIARHAERSIGASEGRLHEVALGIRHRTLGAVERSDDRLHQRVERLVAGARRAVDRAETALGVASTSLRRAPGRLDPEARHLDAVAERVRLLDPATTMARGWSITRTADGRTVRDAAELTPGTELVTQFARGSARSRVEAVTDDLTPDLTADVTPEPTPEETDPA